MLISGFPLPEPRKNRFLRMQGNWYVLPGHAHQPHFQAAHGWLGQTGLICQVVWKRMALPETFGRFWHGWVADTRMANFGSQKGTGSEAV